MKCEKCGKEMNTIMANRFNHEGADSFISYPYTECEEDAVYVDLDSKWTGYGLSEEEMLDTIECPHCGKFPFKNKEIQVYELVRVVCFKTEQEDIDLVQDFVNNNRDKINSITPVNPSLRHDDEWRKESDEQYSEMVGERE